MLILSNTNANQCQCLAMLMLSNANAKQCKCWAILMLSNAVDDTLLFELRVSCITF